MTFSVTRSCGDIVQPSEVTPSGTLNLSVIDKLPIVGMDVHTLHVFKNGHEAAKVIREALSKALVLYYPLAGRFKESSQRQVIDCTGEGVWFIEASADCSLESVDYFDNILSVPQHDLVPTLPPETFDIEPLVKIQLTHFTCKGFVIVLSNCHSLTDGLGAAQFLSAIGEFARGLKHPMIAPVWLRDDIPSCARLARAFGEPGVAHQRPPMPSYRLEHATIDISLDQINKLKKEFAELTGDYCSTFDVVVSSLWRHRTQVIKLEEDTNVKLIFSVNTRKFLDPPLPEGFYGNCFYPVTVTCSSGWLVEASTTEIVKLIKDAKARVPAEFIKWLKSDELDVADPFATPLVYTTLALSEWSRVGFNQVDYGWGRPVQVLPLQGFHIIPTAIVGLPPTPKTGIRLMTWCVTSTDLPSFVDHKMNLS